MLVSLMENQQRETIDHIAEVLQKVRSILFITGAGISADSGLPTYRGIGGLYDVEVTDEGLPIEAMLSGEMFATRPELTWKYLAQIAQAAMGARFNRAHEVIVEMEKRFPRVWTLTQNVDGLHRLAGSQNLIEIHGNMHSLTCPRCRLRSIVDSIANPQLPPHCPDCEAIMKPDVVLFGEMLPEDAVRQLHSQLQIGFDAVVSIGTSAVFPYIQDPMLLARRQGAATIEINPSETILSPEVDYHLAMGAAAAMDKIWARLRQSSA